MAKTPKVKKREVSFRSRAARRNSSPPPKDLAAKPKVDDIPDQEWMYRAQNAGVSKKKKPAKKLTRQQRLRQQKGLENGERNVDRHEKKVADSKTRGRKVQARRADWQDLNEKVNGQEIRPDVSKKQDTTGAKGDGAKAMEGVEMPDLEQSLPLPTTDDGMDAEPEPVSIPKLDSALKTEPQPVTALEPSANFESMAGALEELDDVT